MKITPLKMWVQNVLPVVYDDSLSYYEMVGKINEKTNEIINQVNENTDDIEALNYVIQELGDIDELKALLEQVETIVSDLYTTDIPEMDSANGSAGVADHAARSDHSHPSDSSKADTGLGITEALAGQYVRIKTVESGVPTEFENYMPHEIPSGGTTGQALRKESNGDYAADWEDVHEIPNGGTTGQALRKVNDNNYAANWDDVHEIPSGGASNSVLIKKSTNNYDVEWAINPDFLECLAHIENTSTASKNYGITDYLIYNGRMYKVLSAISQGDTLQPNVNIREESFNLYRKFETGSGVVVNTDLGNPSSTITNLWKSNGMCFFELRVTNANNTTSYNTQTPFFTLPVGFRPPTNVLLPAAVNTDGVSSTVNDYMVIHANGIVNTTRSGVFKNIYFCGCFPLY